MPERFSPVDDADMVFRLIDEGSTFLPAGAVLPLLAWFVPSSADLVEGKQRGRPPGWSVWNVTKTSTEEVRALVNRPAALSFGVFSGAVRAIGKKHERTLDVVADPVDRFQPQPGWDAHCVVEGLSRPSGVSKVSQKNLQTDLAGACVRLG